jgi:hypothetical protein
MYFQHGRHVVTYILPALRPTQYHNQWGAVSPVKRLRREADRSPPTTVEVNNTWINTFTPPFSSLGGWDWFSLERRTLFDLLYQTRVMDDDECGVAGGMSGRGNRSTGRKPVPVPLCLPQIPHDSTRARTQAAAMGSLSYDTASTPLPLTS